MLGKALQGQGHQVRLLPAQFVRPFVKSNKSDYCDAKAIAEGMERENMRFVPIKTEGHSICRSASGMGAGGVSTN